MTHGRTRHVDMPYHFVREFIEEGFLRDELTIPQTVLAPQQNQPSRS